MMYTKLSMKKIMKSFMHFAFIIPLFFIGAHFADAAPFHSDPAGEGFGVTSIGLYSDTQDSYSVNIPNKGDSQTFSVYVDYQNITKTTLYNVYAGVHYNSQGTGGSSSIIGFLNSDSGKISDGTTLTNLPSSWKLEAIGAQAKNHHVKSAACDRSYAYITNVNLNQATSSQGVFIGDLDTKGTSKIDGSTGACSQGHLVVSFRVTNTSTSQVNSYSWTTGSWGACISGYQTRSVQCVSNTGVVVGDSYCASNSKPVTQQSCSTPSAQLSVQTQNPLSVDEDSATLNGYLVAGQASSTWFVIDERPLDCYDTGMIGRMYMGAKSQGSYLSYSVRNLEADNLYYYLACAADSGQTVSGGLRSFRTDDDGYTNPNYNDPEADTLNPDNVDEDSAELNGRIDMNGFNNGLVFFVYGQDRNDIRDVEQDYNNYSSIREQGDDLQKIITDYDLDSRSNYAERVRNLDTNNRYYYRICVEYRDGGSEIICGHIEDFDTDGDNDDDVVIRTEAYQSVRTDSASLCGDLVDDGGNTNERTWIEYRKSSSSSWSQTTKKDRGEVYYCETIHRLDPGTSYTYRACSDSHCASSRTFRTVGTNLPDSTLEVNTLFPDPVYSSSATLRGSYIGDQDDPTTVWFLWGTTTALGTQKRSFTYNGASGSFQDAFTGLRACTRYYYQAVARNSNGTDYGDILSFRTGGCSSTPSPDDDGDDVIIVEKKQTDIDLSRLGLGLSLIRLEIDDNRETVVRGEQVSYEVSWENISTLDLNDIDVKVELPQELRVTSVSRGRFDENDNTLIFTIEDLDEGEDGSMTISGVVGAGTIGNLLTAEATAAFDNPLNDAQENATDYDIDEYSVIVAGLTASIFGLRHITFLGWLTILLGLLIIFLIARWLYLEREELRAQAYANTHRGYQYPPATEQMRSAPEDSYQPYRPNR